MIQVPDITAAIAAQVEKAFPGEKVYSTGAWCGEKGILERPYDSAFL